MSDISGKTTEQVMEYLDELVAERKVNERYEAKLAKQKYKSTADSLFGDENGTTIPSSKIFEDADGIVVAQREKPKEKKPLPK
ncbi:hypothetical protein ACI4B7_27270, partial [Klebsiella pneumoniae]|uniref:hypothetical protein n=1 Tax=Klebsiella pneumoniae TaxID=573 RepID=UPI003853BBC8